MHLDYASRKRRRMVRFAYQLLSTHWYHTNICLRNGGFAMFITRLLRSYAMPLGITDLYPCSQLGSRWYVFIQILNYEDDEIHHVRSVVGCVCSSSNISTHDWVLSIERVDSILFRVDGINASRNIYASEMGFPLHSQGRLQDPAATGSRCE